MRSNWDLIIGLGWLCNAMFQSLYTAMDVLLNHPWWQFAGNGIGFIASGILAGGYLVRGGRA